MKVIEVKDYGLARVIKINYWGMDGARRRLVNQVGKLSRHMGRQ